jgi:hypothetical protein
VIFSLYATNEACFVTSFVFSNGRYAPEGAEIKTFDFSIPVGISYEYMNVCLDARYNIGVSKIADRGSDRNSVFQITLGYKFKL